MNGNTTVALAVESLLARQGLVSSWYTGRDGMLVAVGVGIISTRGTGKIVRLPVDTGISLLAGWGLLGGRVSRLAAVTAVENEGWGLAEDPGLINKLGEDGTLNLLLEVNGGWLI